MKSMSAAIGGGSQHIQPVISYIQRFGTVPAANVTRQRSLADQTGSVLIRSTISSRHWVRAQQFAGSNDLVRQAMPLGELGVQILVHPGLLAAFNRSSRRRVSPSTDVFDQAGRRYRQPALPSWIAGDAVPPMIEKRRFGCRTNWTTAAQAAASPGNGASWGATRCPLRELLRRLSDKPAMSTARSASRGRNALGSRSRCGIGCPGLTGASIYIFTPGQARFTAYFDEAGQIKSGDSVRVAVSGRSGQERQPR